MNLLSTLNYILHHCTVPFFPLETWVLKLFEYRLTFILNLKLKSNTSNLIKIDKIAQGLSSIRCYKSHFIFKYSLISCRRLCWKCSPMRTIHYLWEYIKKMYGHIPSRIFICSNDLNYWHQEIEKKNFIFWRMHDNALIFYTLSSKYWLINRFTLLNSRKLQSFLHDLLIPG